MGIISALGRVRQPNQRVAFMFPDPGDSFESLKPPNREDSFVFQYWPSAVSDSDETTYSEKLIPGGSHPIQQWVGGGSRVISFDAIFTADVDIVTPFARGGQSVDNGLETSPSSRYTVDVAAAIAKIRQYLYPKYRSSAANTIVQAPKRLILVMPGMNLGHDTDAIAVIMKTMSINVESCFPSGVIRVATVSLSFTEVVQRGNGEKSSITFVDRDRMAGNLKRSSKYDYTHGNYPSGQGA